MTVKLRSAVDTHVMYYNAGDSFFTYKPSSKNREGNLYFPNDSISNCQSSVDKIGKLELNGKITLLFTESNLFL